MKQLNLGVMLLASVIAWNTDSELDRPTIRDPVIDIRSTQSDWLHGRAIP
jgi:hypothetical protein